jgi:hypothetical protein
MPLFSQTPLPSASLVLTSSAPLSKDQKTFNSLVKKIDARRARLVDWGEAIPRFKQKYVSDLLPLQERALTLDIELARLLDQACGQKGVTQVEKRKLSALIVDLAQRVLAEREDDEAKALYNAHGQSDFDEEEAVQLDGMKSMLENLFGVELGEDVDMRSAEEVMQRFESHFRAQQEAEQASAAPRKKSARALAREAQREAEEKQMSQSIRDVYRSLVRALHPDREPDPAERQRKTALMQQVNEAYEKGNLLQLLELQLQLEQIDRAHLTKLDPQRLKHYIKILKEQLGELELEIQRIEHEFAAEFGLPPFEPLSPHGIMSLLKTDVATCELRIRQMQEQLKAAGDLESLKAWLKTITLRRRPVSDFDLPF